VPSTISSSSLMYLMNRQMLNPVNQAIPPSTTKDEQQARQVEGPGHQLAEREQGDDAVFTDRERHGARRLPSGATRMMMPTTLNRPCDNGVN